MAVPAPTFFMLQILIAGGGIGGLAAALACQRVGWQVRLYERADLFSEVGAGVQLGPNAVRCLHAWGLQEPLRALACFPEDLQVRSSLDGSHLARMRLGQSVAERYGGPYATIHRADLHGLLLRAVRQLPGVQLHLRHTLRQFTQHAFAVHAQVQEGDAAPLQLQADALLGADGLHSGVRRAMTGAADEPPGEVHLAYRAVVAQKALTQALRSQVVTVWLGAGLHVVHYPVRGGELLNVVVVRATRASAQPQRWDHVATAAELQWSMAGVCTQLQDLIRAVSSVGGVWRLWPLEERPAVAGAHEMAQGAVALLGDAAHPMRPYLAQGAGMAIEDAMALEQVLGRAELDVPERLRHYAFNRWQRVARVQRRAQRNGHIFHLAGPVRMARDVSLRLLGEKLLDMPWLYAGGPQPVSS